MAEVKARFDGKVFVPEEPVDLQQGEAVVLTIKRTRSKPRPAKKSPPKKKRVSVLKWLAENPVDDTLPSDLAYQHDHYLYGTPKKPNPRS